MSLISVLIKLVLFIMYLLEHVLDVFFANPFYVMLVANAFSFSFVFKITKTNNDLPKPKNTHQHKYDTSADNHTYLSEVTNVQFSLVGV